MLKRVAVLFHPRRRRAVEEAEWLGLELARRGVSAAVENGWDPGVVNHVTRDRDLLIALGGDGTIIHVTRMAAAFAVPVVGINLGRVGFLAEMTPDALHENVDALVEERFWIERRTMLDAHFKGKHDTQSYLCLNEVALARGVAPRAVHIRTVLDGHEFTTYTADAVLVATATGSTAYSLAAGGPILYPEAKDFMITPVAPHLHIGRSVIVPGNTVVSVQVSSERAAILSVDGMDERPLEPGDTVEVCRSELEALFARLAPRRYFYEAIADRLK